MNLETGSNAWYVAGARFVDGNSIVGVQLVKVLDCWEHEDGSGVYIIDFCGTRLTNDDKLFVSDQDALAAAIRFQEAKIERVKQLGKLYDVWLEVLHNGLTVNSQLETGKTS